MSTDVFVETKNRADAPRARRSCIICATPDDQELYRWFDPSEGDSCVAHIECAEAADLEPEGDEPVDE